MTLNNHRHLDTRLLTECDAWNGGEGEYMGAPLLIRYRSQLTRNVDLSNHPHLIIAQWSYSEHPSGMPSPDELIAMNNFEAALVDEVERDVLGVLVAVITNAGVRKWVFYAKNAEQFDQRFNTIAIKHPSETSAPEIWFDPGWSHFFQDIVPEDGL
ncbi:MULTISPECIES: DUF695 domain-containing protein [Stenotrophomonas]|uniref:DUF695 domain-containing protein n=1 Tax=Stenotrophomonas maltophilia TaxID=40324 RepID=A0AAD0FQF4_STEMA|nr:DUF695 domain-containing protein [Stenotrophomonas maltophilia]AUI09561.1 hypothetical protein SmaCSM2_21245 [Stenotrophomonas maltophilia]MBA2129969.1 DUF695 domain-containing protein [Stenotrophomonas maltophilia]MBH1680751.1 DUF695 domain-containing protein [Stenotrophomonas maltophilia]MBH1873644.1 DUF695 domain-containing protein [Stenotrophomonas maltophilia]